jgi:thiamine pyrophosphokinase
MSNILSFAQNSTAESTARAATRLQPDKTLGSPQSVVIVNGGPPPDLTIARRIPNPAYVIAVDRGFQHAKTLGLKTDELIGDFDSLDPALLDEARSSGIRTVQHPTNKDATDLDLALQRAKELRASSVTVLCGEGWEDRFDHVAAQLGLLASPEFAEQSVVAWFGSTFASAVHHDHPLRVSGTVGETISILAIGGPVDGVLTSGLRYALTGDTLSPFSTRSVSNEFAANHASISVESGALLVLIPNALKEQTR